MARPLRYRLLDAGIIRCCVPEIDGTGPGGRGPVRRGPHARDDWRILLYGSRHGLQVTIMLLTSAKLSMMDIQVTASYNPLFRVFLDLFFFFAGSTSKLEFSPRKNKAIDLLKCDIAIRFRTKFEIPRTSFMSNRYKFDLVLALQLKMCP